MAPPTSRRHRLSGGQRRVMQDIMACRTAALGGQLTQCDHCGAQVIRYHSCQNRHCPKCQTLAKVRWVDARLRDLLPIPYFHCVFTLPHALNPLAQGNPRLLYGLLFQTASATLQTFGRDPKWLGGELGHHDGAAYLEPNPGTPYPCPLCGDRRGVGPRRRPLDSHQAPRLSLSRQSARPGVSRQISRRPARGRMRRTASSLPGPQRPCGDARTFQRFLAPLWQQPWVVYAKPPFASAQHVLSYLGRYTHRVALSNDRLVALREGQVVFRWRDRRRGNRPKVMTLTADEFIRRFLLHVLPTGFMRIRHYGVLGNRCRTPESGGLPPPVGAASAPRAAPGIRRDRDAAPHGYRHRALSAVPPGPPRGDRHPVSPQAPGRGLETAHPP